MIGRGGCVKFEKRVSRSWGKKISHEMDIELSSKQIRSILLVIALIFIPFAAYFLFR